MTLEALKARAQFGGVPILDDETLEVIISLLKRHQVTLLLELGSGIGYSACAFAHAIEHLKVTSIERDDARFKDALNNAQQMTLNDRVTFIHGNARTIDASPFQGFEALFIDAAKAHHHEFLERFYDSVKPQGLILIDNMALGRVQKHTATSRAARALLRKNAAFQDTLKTDPRFRCEWLLVGDGLAVCVKEEVTP